MFCFQYLVFSLSMTSIFNAILISDIKLKTCFSFLTLLNFPCTQTKSDYANEFSFWETWKKRNKKENIEEYYEVIYTLYSRGSSMRILDIKELTFHMQRPDISRPYLRKKKIRYM